MDCIDMFDINGDQKLAAESVAMREDIIRHHSKNPRALFFCSTSGGKDSQIMYIRLKELVPHDQIIVIHANLGVVEHNGVIEHIINTIEHELTIVKNELYDFIDMVLNRMKFPSSQHRNCTSSLKTNQIYKEIRRVAKERGADTVFNCVGLRAEESRQRALKNPLYMNQELTTKKRVGFDFYPIFNLTTDEVFEGIEKAGQQPHYIYGNSATGYQGNTRLSCIFCIMGCLNDLINGAKEHPEHYHQMVALERFTGHTMFGKSKTIHTDRKFKKNEELGEGTVTKSELNTSKRAIMKYKNVIFIKVPLDQKIGIPVNELRIQKHLNIFKNRKIALVEMKTLKAIKNTASKMKTIKDKRDPNTLEMFGETA